jgi:hypothetical protein
MMDAVTYVKEHQRICKEHTCSKCPLGNFERCDFAEPEELVKAVEEWSKEHPLVTNGEAAIDMMGKMGAPYIGFKKNNTGQVVMTLDGTWWDAEYKGEEV